MADLFDHKVMITIEANKKTAEEFEEFINIIKTALSNQRANGKIDGSKLTVTKEFASQDWHDGLS